ncbi:hypothetical protein [Microviridae sp.]|nr:hypothetical protein [Microviridae sp.]
MPLILLASMTLKPYSVMINKDISPQMKYARSFQWCVKDSLTPLESRKRLASQSDMQYRVSFVRRFSASLKKTLKLVRSTPSRMLTAAVRSLPYSFWLRAIYKTSMLVYVSGNLSRFCPVTQKEKFLKRFLTMRCGTKLVCSLHHLLERRIISVDSMLSQFSN